MRQIQKLYKKEKAKQKEDKQYVVSKNFSNVGKSKIPRHMKVVDKRMRKDLKHNKAKAKKEKKQGRNQNRKAQKKS